MDMLKQIERNEAHNNFIAATERYCELEHQFKENRKYPAENLIETMEEALDAKEAMHKAYERWRELCSDE